MFDSLIIANLFITLGYAFLSVVLLVSFLFSRKNPYITRLAGISNGVLAFYGLCDVLVSLTFAVKAGWGFAQNKIAYSAYFRPSWEFVIVLACMAFPYLRRCPLWLLLPFALLINGRKATSHNDTGSVFAGLFHQEQAILWGMCALYCLVILVLFILSLWIKRLMTEDHL
jgi:hypothetical protein